MRFVLPLPLLVFLVVAYPYGVKKTVIGIDDYPDHLVIYKGEYDIVDIMVPLNSLNYERHSLEIPHVEKNHIIFFIEAKNNDRSEDRSIYTYKNGKATKIMDKGRAVAASADDSKYVFLGAKDGLYVYNPETQKADKYGNFINSVKDMAKEKNTDAIYILTDDRELYKVYDAGTKKIKIDDIKDAEQIMIDLGNNIYYYGKDKKPYVRTAEGETKIIEGLPNGAVEVKLLRSSGYYNGVALIVGNEIYTIFSDGTSQSEYIEFTPEAKPTAYSIEAGMFHYLGYNKKIYEYDLNLIVDYEFNDYDSKSESKEP